MGSIEVVVKEFYDPLNERITEKMLRFINVTAGVELASAVPTRGLPYVDSPTPMFVALAAYLVGVCGGSLWIKIAGLKPRTVEPNWLRLLVVLHNAFCLILSVYMCSGIVAQSIHLK